MNESTSPFDISEESPGTFRLTGEFDAHGTERFEKALAAHASTDVALDMAGVTFIDSSALRALIVHHRRNLEAGGRFRIVSPSRQVERLLELSKLDDFLQVES